MCLRICEVDVMRHGQYSNPRDLVLDCLLLISLLCFTLLAVEDRKLFIGMISKKCTENDIRVMFSSFGQIEECRILRGPDGLSRGGTFLELLKQILVLNCSLI